MMPPLVPRSTRLSLYICIGALILHGEINSKGVGVHGLATCWGVGLRWASNSRAPLRHNCAHCKYAGRARTPGHPREVEVATKLQHEDKSAGGNPDGAEGGDQVEEQSQTPGKKRERVVKTLSKIGSIVWQLRAKPSETVTKLRSKVAENVLPKVEQGVNRMTETVVRRVKKAEEGVENFLFSRIGNTTFISPTSLRAGLGLDYSPASSIDIGDLLTDNNRAALQRQGSLSQAPLQRGDDQREEEEQKQKKEKDWSFSVPWGDKELVQNRKSKSAVKVQEGGNGVKLAKGVAATYLSRPTAVSEGSASSSYLSSLYRFTDDGRRLSSVSRYADDYWISNLLTLTRSRVFQRIFPRLVVCSAVCCVVALVYTNMPFLPFARGQAHTITGSFLGLLIAFRANTGYERYWAARKAWETVQKQCRCLSLLVATALRGRDSLILRTMTLLAAFPYALKQHLRGQHSMKELARILGVDDVEQLNMAENKPLLVCSLLSETLRPLLQGSAPERQVWERCERMLDDLTLVISQTEQLSSTPVPLSYRRHASRFLSLWTLTAPLFLVPQCGPLLAVLAHPLICWALFGSEEAGKIIEEPFGVTREYGPRGQAKQVSVMGMLSTENLPLLRYCEQIKLDIQEIETLWANLPTHAAMCVLPFGNDFSDSEDPIEVMGGADKEIAEMDMNKPLPIIPVLLDSDDNYMNGGEWGR